MKKKYISILIPIYNEEKNIFKIEKELIPVIEKYGKSFEIILINDGSNDRSLEEINKINNCNIFLISYFPNRGMGYAIKKGISYCNGELTVIMDMDFSFPPEEIFNLITYFKRTNADCVVGNHFKNFKIFKEIPFHRLIISLSANFFYSLLIGVKFIPVTSIFRLYKTEMIKNLNIKSNGFEVNSEILWKIKEKKGKIIDVPVKYKKRIYGKSHLRYSSEIKKHFWLILQILRWKIQNHFKINL